MLDLLIGGSKSTCSQPSDCVLKVESAEERDWCK